MVLTLSQLFTQSPILFKFSLSLTTSHSKSNQFLLGLYSQRFIDKHSSFPSHYYSLSTNIPVVCFPPVSLSRKIRHPIARVMFHKQSVGLSYPFKKTIILLWEYSSNFLLLHLRICVIWAKSTFFHFSIISHWGLHAPEQCCPIKLSAVMEMLDVCPVQYGGYWPPMPTDHLKCV